jgi:hypothetical protein
MPSIRQSQDTNISPIESTLIGKAKKEKNYKITTPQHRKDTQQIEKQYRKHGKLHRLVHSRPQIDSPTDIAIRLLAPSNWRYGSSTRGLDRLVTRQWHTHLGGIRKALRLPVCRERGAIVRSRESQA